MVTTDVLAQFHSSVGLLDAGGYVPLGQWRDTIYTPPFSVIKLRYYAHSFSGMLMAHCHMLSHEDEGMVLLMEIADVPLDEPADPGSTTSDGKVLGLLPEVNSPLAGSC